MAPSFEEPQLRELTFVYQPIFGCHSERPLLYEALVRWRRPDGDAGDAATVLAKFLRPAWLPAFTRFTFHAVALDLVGCPSLHRVAVNLTPLQFQLPYTLNALRQLTPELRARFELEVTEQSVADLHGFALRARQLAQLGLPIFLDDVTPDDWSDRWSESLHVSGVKLDMAYLRRALEPTGDARALASFTHHLARLGLRLTAEGVADADERQRLGALGFERFQGFGLGRPLSAATLAQQTPGRPGGAQGSDYLLFPPLKEAPLEP